MTRRSIKTTLKEWGYYDAPWSVPLRQFNEELNEALLSIPEEHRDAAIVEAEDCYDDHGWRLEVSWSRAETLEEYDRRVRAESQHAARRQTEQEAAELRELARLKAKYESTKENNQ